MLSGGAAATGAAGAARLGVVAGLSCEMNDIDLAHSEPIDVEFHPLRFPIGQGASRYYLGAIVGNPLLCAGMLALLVVGAAVQRMTGCKSLDVRELDVQNFSFSGRDRVGWTEALGNLRAPGLCWVPLLFLSQGTSLSGAHLLFGIERTGASEAAAWAGA
eukprot:gene4771-3075_t